MPVLPTIDEAPLCNDMTSDKVIDRPNVYSKFPNTTHNPKLYSTTISLAHSETQPEAAQPKEPSARYRHTPQGSNPFDMTEPTPADAPAKKTAAPLKKEQSFRISEQNLAPAKPVVCRKPVPKVEKNNTHGSGKKVIKPDPHGEEVPTAADVGANLRQSSRYSNSRRYESSSTFMQHSSNGAEVTPANVSSRFKNTKYPSSLVGVLGSTEPVMEDRSAMIRPPPFRTELE